MVSGGGEETLTLSAKASDREVVDGAVVEVSLACVGAAVEGAANGLLGSAEDVFDEKGFGFAETLPVREVVPNRLAPRSCFGASTFCCLSSFGFSSGFRVACSILSFLTARNALMLPGFLLHAFLGHPNIYNRLSSSGK
jgi:hypothetical protein